MALHLDGREQRKHARIETGLDCTVIAGDIDFTARVANLSRGGAGLVGPEGKAELGTQLLILLERKEGDFALALQARVVRMLPQPNGTQYGVHFEDMPPDIDAELLRLLTVLAAGPGQGRRESPRVATRVRVKCASREDFEATLNDLSLGGLSVTSDYAIEVGEALGVDFSVGDGGVITAVSGVAVGVNQLEDGRCRVSVKFEPPTPEDRTRVLLLLELMLALGPAGSRAS
jgi:c-di-GMP-binding flagellar brake protein YcgR